MTIEIIDAEMVCEFNKEICGSDYRCYGIGKVESALHSTYYPGSIPFHHGSIPQVAGAMAFYLTNAHAFYDGNKRVAAVSAITFLELNGFELDYQFSEKEDTNELANVIEATAAGQMNIDELKKWFSDHKAPIA